MVLPGVLVMVGLLLVANGVESLSKTQTILTESTRIPGTVVDFVEESFNISVRGSTDKIIYYPVIEFVDSEGTSRRIKSQFGIYWRLYERGETLEVLFNPRNPDTTKINSFQDVWLTPIVLLIIGLPLLSWGAVLLRRSI